MTGLPRSLRTFRVLPVVAAVAGFAPVARADDRPLSTGSAAQRLPAALPAVDPVALAVWPTDRSPPPGYHWSSKPREAMIDAGTGLLLLGYVPGFAIAASNNDNLLDSSGDSSRWLFLPIAGPFVLAGQATGDFAKAVLVTDGLMQAVGVGLATLGLCWRIPVLVPEVATVRIVTSPLLVGARGTGVGIATMF